jgi:hypothetical protein
VFCGAKIGERKENKEQRARNKEQGFRSETVPTIRFTTVGTAGSEK